MKQQILKFGSNCVGTKSHGCCQLFNGKRFEWYCGGSEKAVQLPTVRQKSDCFNIFCNGALLGQRHVKLRYIAY